MVKEIFFTLSIPRYFHVYFCSALGENKLKISFRTLEVHKSSSIVINFMRFTIASRNVVQNRLKFHVLLITFRRRKEKGISAIVVICFINVCIHMCV